ncbi:unnamed protein product [Rhodiola kirilowii]
MALQRKDQDILNVMSMVTSTKRQLQTIRDHDKYDIQILNLGEEFVDARRPRQKSGITNMQHLQVDCFYTVLDLILQEFNDHFDEINSELLICMTSLSPIDLFQHFNHPKLMKFYPDDFNFGDQNLMEHQLRLYIDNVREDERFSNLKDLCALARVMVDTEKHRAYPLVFRLLKLVLTLPVATATVERCFSAMKIVKTSLRNRMADSFLCDGLICYIEMDLFHSVSNEDVMGHFMKMKTRREQL